MWTYTALVVVLAPVFAAQYGITNFLWFSNIGLLGTLAGIWLRSRLVVSMMAVAVVVPELGWNALFFGRLLAGLDVFGLLDYIFDPGIPLWARLLSLYHVPLPFALAWLVWCGGYDRRALAYQTLLAWIVLGLSLAVSEPWQNINLVYGPIDAGGDPMVRPPVPMLALMVALPAMIYWPTDRLLRRLAQARRGGSRTGDS